LRTWGWLVAAVIAVAGIDVIVSVFVELEAIAVVGLVSASAGAVSALASAIAATRSVEVSRRVELAGRRATEALSRSLLPGSIEHIPNVEDGAITMTIREDGSTDQSVIVTALVRIRPDGRRISQPRLPQLQARYVRFLLQGIDADATAHDFLEWAVRIEVEFMDRQRLVVWSTPLNIMVRADDEPHPLNLSMLHAATVGMHGDMQPVRYVAD
jgi:hypothetical protein